MLLYSEYDLDARYVRPVGRHLIDSKSLEFSEPLGCNRWVKQKIKKGWV